jgi:transcriptional regulator
LYIPEHFRVEDRETALGFMRANPFAVLVSSTADGPFATHVPVIVREDGERILVRGHVAKANPHWKYLQEQPKTLMIFHGPHAYISPSNYSTRENVPTWNYGAVHVYGNTRVYSQTTDLLEMLHDLIPTFEAAYEEQWSALTEAYRTRMLSHIVGFELAVAKIEAKFKLSQNRTRDEQQNVIESLSRSEDSAIAGTARLMCEHGLGTREINLKADK